MMQYLLKKHNTQAPLLFMNYGINFEFIDN